MNSHAEVIIPLAVPKTFTYAVPEGLREQVLPGCRVEVEFGGAKRYAGVVSALHDRRPQGFEPKPILNLLDVEPVVHAEQLELWRWMADYYLCSQGEVMAAALPAHFKLSSETVLVFNEDHGDDFTHLDGEEYLVAEGLLLRGELRLDEVQDILDVAHVYPVVKRLIEKRVCIAWESLKERYTPRKEHFVRLHAAYASEEALEGLLNGWDPRAPKQLELLLAFLQLARSEGEVRQPDLLKRAGATADRVKALVEKGVFVVERRAVDRIRPLPKEVLIDFELSERQSQALAAVQAALRGKPVCLLHGVTSSGKTQIYIRLMEEVVRAGRQVLFLLPEIALTAQVIRRLQHHFGGYISVYHSKFSPNERVEIWNRVRTGETRILLGARSALFLPFCDLGLVIVDEEHDPSYKQQEPAPRYHARDTAIYYASRLGARVLLGSATPSLESYRNAVTGKYGFVTLGERFGGIDMPAITLVDMRLQTPPRGQRPIFSEPLLKAMREALAAKRQVILFQNRRGYTPYMVCGVCSHIPQCSHCDVTLTYHKLMHRLQCHYCGTTYPRPLACPACGSSKWQERNFGTERIEEEIRDLMPAASVGRMDLDSIKGKTAHDAIIQTFEQRQLDILVGTQMVVKGLDFEHVSLVGILDADGLLGFADFRVNERAFQLMEQVSGRAGRRGAQGTVLIQTTQTGHPVLDFVLRHDYAGFFTFESEARASYRYPPFTRLIRLTFRHRHRDRAEAAAALVAGNLSAELGAYLIGPAEPVVNRVREMYRTELVLKLPKEGSLVARARTLIRHQMAVLGNDRQYRSVVVDADVDPA